MNKKQPSKTSKGLKIYFVVCLLLFVMSAAVLCVCTKNQDFAEFYCKSVSAFSRFVLSFVTGFVPISFAELLMLALPFLIIIDVVKIVVRIKKGKYQPAKTVMKALSVFFIIAILFINNIGVGYLRYPLEKNLSVQRTSPDRKTLYENAQYVTDKLEEASKNITYSNDGSSINPHSWSTVDKLVDEGYDNLRKKYDFISPISSVAKKVLVSPLMTYTHISGVYAPFTGEANVNTNYPDYVVVFTVAHEKAHQRGIAGEDDANFVAFLVCAASDYPYIRYSGYLNLYEYVANSLYSANRDLYYKMVANVDTDVRYEMIAYSNFFDKYRESTASKVSGAVNDTYLKFQGTEGSKSYGMVTDLAVAYYKTHN